MTESIMRSMKKKEEQHARKQKINAILNQLIQLQCHTRKKQNKTREYPAKTTLAGVQQGLPLILPNYCSNRRVD